MLTPEQVAVRADFDRLINMSAEEMIAHYATPESDYASLPHAIAKKLKQTSGKAMGKQALALKQTESWGDDEYIKAAECTRSIKRFLGRQVAYQTAEGTPTPFAISLMNRGHSPAKAQAAKDVEAAKAPPVTVSEGITTEQIQRQVSDQLRDWAKTIMGGEIPEDMSGPWSRYDGVYLVPPSVVFEWMGSLFRMSFVLDAAGKVTLQPDTLIEVTMEPVPVTEPADVVAGEITEVEEAAAGKPSVWKGIMIRAGAAVNKAPNGLNRVYTEEALEAAVADGLFDNVPGYDRTDAEHGKREGETPAGYWGKASWDAVRKAVVNIFTWAEGAMPKAVNGKIKTLVAEGKTSEVPGFSVVANILTPKGKPHIVAAIEEILSCDPVVSPSAGGVVLQVTESHQKEQHNMKLVDALTAKGLKIPTALAAAWEKHEVSEADDAANFMISFIEEKSGKTFSDAMKAFLMKNQTDLIGLFAPIVGAEAPADPDPNAGTDPEKAAEAARVAEAAKAAAISEVERIRQQAQEALATVHGFALEGLLAKSGLDASGQELVRQRINGQPFDAAKVQEAITATKDLLAGIRRSMNLSHISAGQDQGDKVQQAWNDLFMMDVQDPQVRQSVSESAGAAGLSKHRGGEVRSIKRLAEMVLGRAVDWLDREQVQEAMDSVIAAKVLTNGMNLRVAYKWNLETEYTHYRRIVNIVPLPDLKTKNILTLGSLSDWSEKNSSTGFGTLTAQGAVNQSYTPVEVGGIHYIEWKNFVNDDTNYFQQIPDMHYDQAILYVNTLIWAGLVNPTAVLADAAAVFSTARGNLINMGLDAEGTALEAAIDALQNMGRPGATDSSAVAKVVPLLTAPGFIWTSPRISQRKLAHNLTTIAFGQANSIATYSQNLGITPIVNPLATDANDWGLFGKDPRGIIEMGVYGSETPIITISNDPGVGRRFTHNEIGIKGELEVAAAWVTHRNSVYAQVAG